MLWLCILLPRSALEAPAGEPRVPGDGHRRARTAQAALETLALWALQWSSQVSHRLTDIAGIAGAADAAGADEAALWLEIGASRRLHGDAPAVRSRIDAALAPLGYAHRLGIAPTPQGAALLARAEAGLMALTRAQLERQLAPLPLGLLSLPPESLAALHGAGLRAIGELLALPDAAVARRFGPAASLYLQRLRGAVREPLRMVRAPETFAVRCEFSGAVTDATALLFPLQRLLAGLQGCLRARDRAVQRYTLCLEHHRRAATRLTVSCSRPARDVASLLALARERLAATALVAPVTALGVEAPEFLQPCIMQDDLFSRAAQQSEQLQQVIDRLAARLGADAVRALDRVADHRPERAWRNAAAPADATPATAIAAAASGVADATPPASPSRPCWLLPEPRRIDPPGELLAGPERIESGWWDGADIARDYYLARDDDGAHLWVFHDLRTNAWCLHGLWS